MFVLPFNYLRMLSYAITIILLCVFGTLGNLLTMATILTSSSLKWVRVLVIYKTLCKHYS